MDKASCCCLFLFSAECNYLQKENKMSGSFYSGSQTCHLLHKALAAWMAINPLANHMYLQVPFNQIVLSASASFECLKNGWDLGMTHFSKCNELHLCYKDSRFVLSGLYKGAGLSMGCAILVCEVWMAVPLGSQSNGDKLLALSLSCPILPTASPERWRWNTKHLLD